MKIRDFKGNEYTATELVGMMAVTDKGQTVDIKIVRDEDAQVSYPNGRRGWEPISELSVLVY